MFCTCTYKGILPRLHPHGLCQGAKYQHGVKLTNWEKTLTIWNGVVNKRKGSNQFEDNVIFLYFLNGDIPLLA